MNPVLTANLLWIAGVVVNLAIIVAALLILPKRRKPTAAMAWLLGRNHTPLEGEGSPDAG